jgi:hypothetical protein
MKRLINSNSTVTNCCRITARKPEDGGDIFSETSDLITATRYKVPKDIYHRFRRENIPEDSVLGPYRVFLYGEADQP